MTGEMRFLPIAPEHDEPLAGLIRDSLRSCGLDIPGTAYYDAALDRLSAYYAHPGRAYFVLADGLDGSRVLGGAGFAECVGLEKGCELQKLYLCPEARGKGNGAALLRFAERKAAAAGYARICLETHSVLAAAIRLYERTGYREIPRPVWVTHSAMDRFYLKELTGSGFAGIAEVKESEADLPPRAGEGQD